MVRKSRKAADINSHPNAALLSLPKWGTITKKIEGLAQGIHLVVELAVREVLHFQLEGLPPMGIMRQFDPAALNKVNVAKESRALRSSIGWHETYVKRAKSLAQVASQSRSVARPLDQNRRGLAVGNSNS
jgi:hypothetical protein